MKYRIPCWIMVPLDFDLEVQAASPKEALNAVHRLTHSSDPKDISYVVTQIEKGTYQNNGQCVEWHQDPECVYEVEEEEQDSN